MKRLLLIGLAAFALAACGPSPQGGATGSMDPAQQAQQSGMSPWLAGAAGFLLGRTMSPSAPQQQIVTSPQVVERRTVIIREAPKQAPVVPVVPPKPVAVAPPPPPAPKPVVPSYAPKPSYQPAPAPRVTYSSSFRSTTTPRR